MTPLIEMMMNAGGGQAMQNMAKQFGISPTQVQSAMEALMPAFSVGMQRNVADPMGLGKLMQGMFAGNHANYFDDVTKAFTQTGQADGNNVLGQLFGSKDVSRAVADQAAAATGIGANILKQMLPAMASMVMGGMAKQTQAQMAAGTGGGNIFGQVIEEMMKNAGGGAAQQPQASPMGDNPLGNILKGMFGGGAQQPSGGGNPWGQILEQMTGGAQSGGQNPMGDNPLGEILKQMTGGAQSGGQNPMGDNPLGKILDGMFGGGQAAPQRQAAPQQDSGGASGNAWGDALNEMFKTGQKNTETYQKGVESIFDQFKQGMDRNR
jgi:hypothetical protein